MCGSGGGGGGGGGGGILNKYIVWRIPIGNVIFSSCTIQQTKYIHVKVSFVYVARW